MDVTIVGDKILVGEQYNEYCFNVCGESLQDVVEKTKKYFTSTTRIYSGAVLSRLEMLGSFKGFCITVCASGCELRSFGPYWDGGATVAEKTIAAEIGYREEGGPDGHRFVRADKPYNAVIGGNCPYVAKKRVNGELSYKEAIASLKEFFANHSTSSV